MPDAYEELGQQLHGWLTDILKPYPSEHAARQQDPGQYKAIRRKNDEFGPGIHVLYGIKEDNGTEVQSIRFDASKFTPAAARAWLKKHKYTANIEAATRKSADDVPGELCPYLDCAHDLAIPDIGWYQCGCCGRAFYADDCKTDYADYTVLRAQDYGAPPDEPTMARDLGPSWASPEVMDAAKARQDGDLHAEAAVLKANEEERTLTAVVYPAKPIGWEDTQGDWLAKSEIRKAAHRFLVNSQRYDLHHKEIDVPREKTALVESWLAPVDFDWPTPDGSSYHVTEGSWIVTTKFFDDDLWARVRSGEFRAYSIRGLGKRRPLAAPQTPQA